MILGSDHIWSIERIYQQYLKRLGLDCQLVGVQNWFFEYYHKNYFNKFVFRSGFSRIYNHIYLNVVVAIEAFRPDLILVFKGMEVNLELLKWIRKHGIPVVNYNPDNPFIFSSKGSGNRNITDSIGFYDMHLTYDTTIQQRIINQFGIQCEILPFGFDVSDKTLTIATNAEEINRLCFLGNPDKERAKFLSSLADSGLQVDVYGNYWDKFLSHKNIQIFSPVYDVEFWITLRKYRVQLNLMRKHNLNSHNMRTFEVPGVGGILLAPRTQDHERFFDVNKEIFLYSNLDECKTEIYKIINFDKEVTANIRDNARNRSINSGYTYCDRTKLLLEFLKRV